MNNLVYERHTLGELLDIFSAISVTGAGYYYFHDRYPLMHGYV